MTHLFLLYLGFGGDGGIFYFEHKNLFYFFTFRFSKRLFANLETICLVLFGFCGFFWFWVLGGFFEREVEGRENAGGRQLPIKDHNESSTV